MKKSFFKVLAVVLVASVLLTGCLTLIKGSYKEFTQVETDLSAWGFYGKIDSGRQIVLSEYETLRGTSKRGYNELYDAFDNQKPLYDILRIGVTALDLKNQAKTELGQEAYYDFDDMKDFVIKKDSAIKEGYVVTFKQPVSYNNFPERDLLVDSVLEKIYFDYEIKAVVSVIASSRDKANIKFSSYVVNAPSVEKIEELKEGFNRDEDGGNGKIIKYNLQEAVESNYFEITASKTEMKNGVELSKYEKTIRLTNNVEIKVTHKETDEFLQKTKEKKLPVQNFVKGFEITFNKLEGFLGWNITYDFGGELVYSGESYFQGNKKFLLKEMFAINTSKTMSFESSVINEISFDDTDFAFKMIKGNKFTSLKSQNVLKVGAYNNEPQAYILSKDKTLQVATFRKYG